MPVPTDWFSLLPIAVALAGAALVLFDRVLPLMAALLIQYVALTLLTVEPLGSSVALVKLLAGALTTLLLWSSLRAIGSPSEVAGGGLMQQPPFRLVGVLLVLTAGWGMGRAAWTQVQGVGVDAELSASIMLAFGLMQIGLFQRPLRLGLGLLTTLAGFEVIYAAIEPSLAIVALLAGVNMGVAIVIGHLVGLWAQTSASGREPT